jgi:hypothetical protein
MKQKVQNLEQLMKEAGIDCAPYLQEAGLLRVRLAIHDAQLCDSFAPKCCDQRQAGIFFVQYVYV